MGCLVVELPGDLNKNGKQKQEGESQKEKVKANGDHYRQGSAHSKTAPKHRRGHTTEPDLQKKRKRWKDV